jgi:hypothetical protein
MPITQYITVALATALKFIAGPLTGLALGLTWYETALCTIVGAMATIIIVSVLGKQIIRLINHFRKTPPKRFSKRSRLAVRVWQRFGLLGIAGITPIFLTPIGGAFLALSFKVPLPKLLFYMLIACIFWGVIFSFLIFQLPNLRG